MTAEDIADEPGNERLLRWEARTDWPLAGVALFFLVLYSFEVLLRPPDSTRDLMDLTLTVLYVPFAVDYFVRLALARNRFRWILRNLLDLAILALPFLRPLRILRLLAAVGVLQRALGGATRGRVVMYTAFTAVIMVYASSLAVLEAERLEPDARIRNFGDAVWWAISTITTVGYGDFFPVTVTGRIIAVLLMVGGISLIGTITATVAAWIVSRVAEEDTAHQTATVAHIVELKAEIARLTEVVAAQQESRPPDDSLRIGSSEPPT